MKKRIKFEGGEGIPSEIVTHEDELQAVVASGVRHHVPGVHATATRRYKFVGGKPVLDWIREQFGIDPNYCSRIVFTIDASLACTAELSMYATPEMFDTMPDLVRDEPDTTEGEAA